METPSSKRMKHGFAEISRETGVCTPKSFSTFFSASQVVVEKLDLYGKLNGHEGCVNTVEFNSTGDTLVSGSDDKHVMFWNWASKTKTFSYASGHFDNIFQAKFMPLTDDKRIVTSAADGQVRLGEISENGQVRTRRLGKHQGRVHSLAVEPGSPHVFFSCGEDGLVQHFDLRHGSASKLFRCFSSEETNRQHSNMKLNAILWAPMTRDEPALPNNLKKIMESNRQSREDQSPVTLAPDVIMHVLRLQRRQMFGYVERRRILARTQEIARSTNVLRTNGMVVNDFRFKNVVGSGNECVAFRMNAYRIIFPSWWFVDVFVTMGPLSEEGKIRCRLSPLQQEATWSMNERISVFLGFARIRTGK
ncbi:hypothetical protein V6N11_025239 [Hibiscus sabdariffa]|uniref:Uncharacterized protein n=1 Tax=Hibiscus sabdariffa TaxID=183260 RepID=A0ABR2QPG6_9ROSI